ncbi:hypothetical protein ACRW4C_25020, partial [Escherichia coli]
MSRINKQLNASNSNIYTPVFVESILKVNSKRTARAVLTGMCYSAGSAMRHGSSSLTRLTGQ